MNPFAFQPFAGLTDDASLQSGGRATLPDEVGIGFEKKSELLALFADLA